VAIREWPRTSCGTATAVLRIAGCAETIAGASVIARILNLPAERPLERGGCDGGD
jgi:hypothetical protein